MLGRAELKGPVGARLCGDGGRLEGGDASERRGARSGSGVASDLKRSSELAVEDVGRLAHQSRVVSWIAELA